MFGQIYLADSNERFWYVYRRATDEFELSLGFRISYEPTFLNAVCDVTQSETIHDVTNGNIHTCTAIN